MAVPYPGNVPSNVNKDARYSVVNGPDGYRVRLIFQVSHRERALLTTDDHAELVEMVNEVKLEHNGVAGGAFYINEYNDVLVPTMEDGTCYAGQYEKFLEFDLSGDGSGPIISPEVPPGLQPGDAWNGPHVGVRYKLTAGAKDIAYTRKAGPNREITERLSFACGAKDAERLARRLGRVKGESGGRIYINEARAFFSPPSGPDDQYTYLGSLDEDLWFPPPDVPGRI